MPEIATGGPRSRLVQGGDRRVLFTGPAGTAPRRPSKATIGGPPRGSLLISPMKKERSDPLRRHPSGDLSGHGKFSVLCRRVRSVAFSQKYVHVTAGQEQRCFARGKETVGNNPFLSELPRSDGVRWCPREAWGCVFCRCLARHLLENPHSPDSLYCVTTSTLPSIILH